MIVGDSDRRRFLSCLTASLAATVASRAEPLWASAQTRTAKPHRIDIHHHFAPPAWVVDPLDGTVNYVHDVPAYCVSIGLLVDGRPAVGVIYDPRLNEMFTAATGLGASTGAHSGSGPTLRPEASPCS